MQNGAVHIWFRKTFSHPIRLLILTVFLSLLAFFGSICTYRLWMMNVNGSLFSAAASGDMKQARILIDNGIDPNWEGDPGITPLMLAAENGHVDMVQFLLSKGAIAQKKDVDGETALMKAKKANRITVIHVLEQAGVHE